MFLYLRELPGGGLVTIEATSGDGSAVSCRVAVERRSDSRRREGHTPPVIAEVSAPSQSAAFRTLYEIAADNVAVARGLLIWQARRVKHDVTPGATG